MRLISKNRSKANGNFLEVLELSYKTHYNLLFNYGLKFINDPALIEDLIQDIFVKLCKRGNADDINDLKVYLLRALRNAIYDHYGVSPKSRLQNPFYAHSLASLNKKNGMSVTLLN